MTGKKTRSAVWAMVNWGIVQDAIEEQTTLVPDQESIEMAIENIEHDYSEAELFKFEAEELEQLLISQIIKILQVNRGKEIKKRISQRDREQKQRENEQQDQKVGVQIMPFNGNMKDLKDMGLDPDMVEALTKSMFDQLFGSKKKPKKEKDDDEDEDDDPGSSFYL